MMSSHTHMHARTLLHTGSHRETRRGADTCLVKENWKTDTARVSDQRLFNVCFAADRAKKRDKCAAYGFKLAALVKLSCF